MEITGRTYFLANACQVCKSKKASCVCEICKMVFYCGREHRRSDWFDHSRICWAVNKIRGRCESLWELHAGKDLTGFKHEVARKVSELLKRPLRPWELEMIYHPRVCGVCGEHNAKKLSSCGGCEFVFACGKRHFRKDHVKWCKTLKLYSELIIYQSCGGKPGAELSEVPRCEAPTSMADFVSRNCQFSGEYKSLDIQKALTSELLTYPLTVFNALREIGVAASPRLGIAFIGAENQAEVEPMSKWEAHLLHRLEGVETLTLTFLGPELRPPAHERSGDLCDECRKRGRNLKFEFITGKFYHEHPAAGANDPALICAFNSGMYRECGFGRENSWKDTIQKLFTPGNPPVLISEYTRRELGMVLERIGKLCGDVDVVVPPQTNPFSSLKPGLNIISEDESPVIFKNYFYAILQKK